MLRVIKGSGDKVTLSITRPLPSPLSPSPSSPSLPAGRSFDVEIAKKDGALGLKIAGGKDRVHGRGRVFIRSLTQGSAAAESKQLQEGDILLKV